MKADFNLQSMFDLSQGLFVDTGNASVIGGLKTNCTMGRWPVVVFVNKMVAKQEQASGLFYFSSDN